jgi:hypothetical protein
VKKIALDLVTGAETEFTDRGCILAQIVEWAEKCARFPVVVFSCGRRLQPVAAMGVGARRR